MPIPAPQLTRRRALLTAAVLAVGALTPQIASAAPAPGPVPAPDVRTPRHGSWSVDSAELGSGLYQVAYSRRNDALWVTSSVGYPPVTESRLLKVDPHTMQVVDTFTPPVTDPATQAREAVYGVAVDDEQNTVWTTNTVDNSLAVYSQRTGEHLATVPGVRHPRDVVVDAGRHLVWTSGLEEGSLVAFDTRTFEEKRRVTVPGAQPAGVAVDPRTGAAYAADLAGGRIIAVAPGSAEPRLIPVGKGAIDVALSADGRTAWTADQQAGTVSTVDLGSGTVRRTTATGAGPLAVSVEDCTGRVYVAHYGAGRTKVLEPRTGEILADLATGANSDHVVTTPLGAYVVDKAAAGPEAKDSIHRIRPPR